MDKSFAFAVRVINLFKLLCRRKEYVLSKQLLRSGTAVGALVRESEHAQSRADFISKLSIALKEADETMYWLELLNESGTIDVKQFESLSNDLNIIIGTLINIIKKLKERGE